MNFTLKSVMCALLLTATLGFCCVFAGCDSKSLKVYQEENISEITRGNTLDISVEANGFNDEDKFILKVEGDAIITDDGKLTAKTDAVVGSEIKVWAEAGETKSNVLKITVVDLVPSSIRLNTAVDKVKVGTQATVNLSVALDPTYSTVRNYDLNITKIDGAAPTDANRDWATIDGDNFKLSEDAPVGTIFEITASIVGHSDVKGTATITVIATDPVDEIQASDVTIDTASDANKTAEVTAYFNDSLVDTTLDMFTYTSADENVATVNANGVITPVGHGTTTITVASVDSGVSTSFNVNVIVPPTSIELQNVSQNIKTTNTMSFGKSETLTLSLKGTNANFATCANNYTYSFQMLDSDGNALTTPSSEIATATGNTITFKQTGKVKVTITSDSALNGVSTTEATKTIIVNVNDGVNIDTVAELNAYAQQTANKVANILGNISLTATENFGQYSDGQWQSLEFTGDRQIFGNGYTISTEQLPLATSDKGGSDFLKFSPTNYSTPFTVEVRDLIITGCGGVNGVYTGDLDAYANNPVVLENGKYANTYRRGLRINAPDYENTDSLATKGYAKDLLISNVTVSGFDVGIRADHAVGTMTDINVSNCFSNGLELSQNILTLNNVTLGQLGAFGIEMTPDDMKNIDTTPKGTAGANYDQTPKLTLTGTINSTNYNNGSSTPYMEGLSSQLGGMSIPNLIDAIIAAGIDQVTAGISDASVKANTQVALADVLNSCLKKDIEGEDYINFYLLIFVNKQNIKNYDKGNTEGVFAEYESNGEDNMINVANILAALASTPGYQDYKKYQYIQMDLPTGTTLGNIGQVVLVNQAYDPNYVSTNA